MEIAKYVLPVVVGSMSGMMLITIGETAILKMPAGNGKSVLAYATEINALPDKTMLFLLVNYAVFSVAAGVIATVISGRTSAGPSVVVGILLTLAGLYNMTSLPHPAWFTAANLVVYLLAALAGYMAARKKSARN